MKRFLITTALVLTTAGGAHAQMVDSSSQLRAQVGNYLATTNYMVDVDSLTDEQVNQLYASIQSGGGEMQNADVKAVLNDNNIMASERPATIRVGEADMPRGQLYAEVSNSLVGTEFEGRAYTLTDEEIAGLYTVINGSEDGADKNAKIAAYFN
jgi:PKD repeat protein